MSDNPRQGLFLEISRNLVDEELRDLRNYVSGAGILPAGFVQKANAQEIFTQLEKERKLKAGDLSLLVDLLTKIGRHDYAERAGKVAEKERKGQKTRKRSAASVSSSDQEQPAKRQNQPPGAKQVDVSKYFDKVVRGASANWDDLARKLKFEENEIDGIEELKRGNDSRCREMLKRWRNRKGSKTGKAATLQALKKALKKIGHKLTADSLEDLSDSSDSSDD